MNTPQAITELHKLADEARKGRYQAACDLYATCDFLGIELSGASFQDILKRQRGDVDETQIAALINARNIAREAKNFKEADRIRNELVAMGIVLKDSKEGTTWEHAR